MAVTKLGKEFKKLRIDHEINRKEMAKAIGVSEATLTNIEGGKEEVTSEIMNKVFAKYADPSNATLAMQLSNAARDSIKQVVFDMSSLSADHKDMILEVRSKIACDIADKQRIAKEKAAADKKAKAEARRIAKGAAAEKPPQDPSIDDLEEALDKAA